MIFDALRAAAEGGDSATGEAAPAEAAAGELSQQEGETVIAKCYQQLAASYETRFGGFSRAPKFPTPGSDIPVLVCIKNAKDVFIFKLY